jgi:hypothetical protein
LIKKNSLFCILSEKVTKRMHKIVRDDIKQRTCLSHEKQVPVNVKREADILFD